MSQRSVRWLVVAILGTSAAAFAQSGPTPSGAFDVASVKESESLALDGVFRSTPGRFTVTNLSVRWILRYAFRLRDYQVIGMPAWTETRYQIDARFGNAAATDEEIRGMLRRLLADRFTLRTRREQRTIPIYELKRARADGTLGPKLTPPSKACEGRYCMFQTAGSIKGFSRTIAQLIPLLDEVMKGPVVDRTGLTGTFDFDVTWGDDGDPTKPPSDQTPERRADLLTALREQLGLTLDATRAPYDVLVVESIARPTPD
jgi:uncharacterized protein (TIGR03435 family)